MLAVGALAAMAIITVGCTGLDSPDGWSGVVFDGDTLFANFEGDELVALSADASDELWRFPDDDREEDDDVDLDGIYGEVATADQIVIVGGYDGSLYALDASDGSIVWSDEVNGPIIGGAAIADGLAVVGSDDGEVRAYELATGDLVWARDLDGRVWARPVIDEGVVYIGTLAGELFALDLEDGRPRWDAPYEADAGFPAIAAIAGETLVVGSLDKRLHAIDKGGGALLWKAEADNWFYTQPVIDDDLVFAGNLDGKLYAVRMEDGEIAWSYETDDPIRSSPVVSDDTVIVADKGGIVHGVRRADGERVWVTEDLDTTLLANLTIHEGSVYVRGKNGALWAVEPGDGAVAQVRRDE